MKPNHGWDNELHAITERIRALGKEEDRLGRNLEMKLAQAEKEVERVGRPQLSRIQRQIKKLEAEREKYWVGVREKGVVKHPAQRKRFTRNEHAAECLAAYWLGRPMRPESLVRRIMDDFQVCNQAHAFATNLTEPNSPERAYADKAYDYLWKDYDRGG